MAPKKGVVSNERRRLLENVKVIFKYLHAEKGPVRLKASENKAMHMARWILNNCTHASKCVHFLQSMTYSQKIQTITKRNCT